MANCDFAIAIQFAPLTAINASLRIQAQVSRHVYDGSNWVSSESSADKANDSFGATYRVTKIACRVLMLDRALDCVGEIHPACQPPGVISTHPLIPSAKSEVMDVVIH